jgi:imidazolonepropionase-like amidohydrolase
MSEARQGAPAPAFTLLRAAQLVDGRGGPPVRDAAVLVEGQTIRAVGPAGEVRAPDGAPVAVHDYGDATLLPGLIDAHTHLNGFGDGRVGDELATLPDEILLLQAARNARVHLEAGVTTLRDCGTKGTTGFRLRQAVAMGVTPAPRLVLSGRPITITGGHLWYFGGEADGVDDVRRAVRQLIKEGADFIKLVATGGSTRTSSPTRPALNADEVQAIVDEAHKFGKPTAAHSSSIGGVLHAVEAGVDTIVHCLFTEPDGSSRFRPDVAEKIASSGRWVDFTLAQSGMRLRMLQERAAAGGPPSAAERLEMEQLKRARETRQDHFRRLLELGVKMVSGSDSSWAWYPMGHFAEEVIEHAEWGMGAGGAIVSATADAARCLQIDGLTGTVEGGKAADLLVVDGDPLHDIQALRRVRDVFLGGQRVRRESQGQ